MTDWPIRSLGEVCDFVRGVTYDKADARSEMKSGFIPLLRATNITEKGLLRDDFVFVPKNGVRADQKLISGDALITIASGSASVVGRSVLVEDPGEMTFGAFCGVLRPSAEILPRYLSHFMSSRSVRAAWSEAAQGTNINNLKRDDILQTECLLPPLEEQKRIVALLDAATARVTELTACYEQARTHATDLFTSALRDALESNPDWPVKILGDICELISRGRAPSYCEVGGVVVLNQKCVRNGRIDFGPSRRTDNLLKAVPQWAYLREGDTLINSTGAGTLGRASFVEKLDEPTTFDTHLTVVRPMSDFCWPAFVGLVLDGREEDIVDLAGGATGQTELPREAVRSFEIPVPPLEEQKMIVTQLDLMRAKTSEMVAAYDAKLTAAKNLRQSILEAAFAGEL